MIKRLAPMVLLLTFFALAVGSARGDSPTMDEQNHIARGLAYLRTGDPRLSIEHPPLVNSLSALPLLTLPVRLPTDDWSWDAGEWYRFADQLLWYANQDVDRMVFLARLPIICLSLFLGALLYRVTGSWAGSAAGLLALILYVFDPNILAHARYSTTDMGGAAFIFLAAVALWWAGRTDFQVRPIILAGGAFGLALSAKLSAVAFGPIFGLLALIGVINHWRQRRLGRREVAAAAMRLGLLYLLAALLVVWAVFGFDWGALPDGGPPVPMPVFWRGVGAIFDFSGGGRPAFLLGHFSIEGFRSYFPVAFGVKTPLPTLLLTLWAIWIFLAGAATRIMKMREGKEEWQRVSGISVFLILPPIIYFAISTQSALNLGYRHLLPILPFLFAFIAVQAANRQIGKSKIANRLLLLLLLWLVVNNLSIYPHYLSSFNEIVGPEDGHRVLVDSNIDWGQDLKRLKRWMGEEEVARVRLAWFGSAYPDYYDIAYDPLPGLPHHFDLWESLPFDPAAPEPGVYAISVSMLQELHRRDEDKTAFAWFRAREPDDRVGYSILIYEVP